MNMLNEANPEQIYPAETTEFELKLSEKKEVTIDFAPLTLKIGQEGKIVAKMLGGQKIKAIIYQIAAVAADKGVTIFLEVKDGVLLEINKDCDPREVVSRYMENR